LKKIKGFEDYVITEEGKVFSRKTNSYMTTTLSSRGYPRVRLSNNGKRYTKTVHRLVAESYIPNPENKPQVNHIDGCKTNNSIFNLEWCTSSENLKHAFKLGLRDGKGENHSQAKLNEVKVRVIKRMIEGNVKQKDIAGFFNIHFGTVSAIKKKNIWSHVENGGVL
jgi:hypothetical protein